MRISPKSPNRVCRLSPMECQNGRMPDLEVGDLVLVRHKKGGLSRSLLRRVTNSYWDHAAMVIFGKNLEKGYAANVIVESIQYGVATSLRHGVEIHRLEKYLMEPDKYDIGIKRFSWLDEEMKNRVRAYVLMNVDSPYYPIPTTKLFFAWLLSDYRRNLLQHQRFSCSGFIQKAFYEAADWGIRPKIVFKRVGYTPMQMQDVTSPGDIARSEACDWLWNEH